MSNKKKKRTEKGIIVFWNKLTTFWKVFWSVTIVVFAIGSYYLIVLDIKEKNQTPAEKKKNVEHQEGDLKPKKLFRYYEAESNSSISTKPVNDGPPIIRGIKIRKINSGGLFFQYGNNIQVYDVAQLFDGVDLFGNNKNTCDTLIHLYCGIHEDRLYASVVFRDLEKEEVIGSIEFNHWNLYLPNLMTFYNDDSTLEVKDKHGRIVFSLKYLEVPGNTSATIQLNGYFISPKNVLVHVGSPYLGVKGTSKSQCYPKDDPKYKEKVEIDIGTIVSVKPKDGRYKL